MRKWRGKVAQDYDARITRCVITSKAGIFALDTLQSTQDFDALVDVAVGKALNAVINRIQVWGLFELDRG